MIISCTLLVRKLRFYNTQAHPAKGRSGDSNSGLTLGASLRSSHGEACPKEDQEGDKEDGCHLLVAGTGRDPKGQAQSLSLAGTPQKGNPQASVALCVDSPKGRRDSILLEGNGLVSTGLGTEVSGAAQADLSTVPVLTERHSVAGTQLSPSLSFLYVLLLL